MNGADRRDAMKRLFLTVWALATVTLVCCVAMLAYEMNRMGGIGTPAPPKPIVQPAEPAATEREAQDITLYFADGSGQRLQPEAARIDLGDSTIDNCRKALEALIAGSQGVLAPVLPASVKIRGLYVLEGGELVVDFSIDLETDLRKVRSASVESLMVYSVVDTLTQPALKGAKGEAVTRVRFLIEGAPPRETFPAHLDLSRAVEPDPQWVGAA
jgi:hypothetical protein